MYKEVYVVNNLPKLPRYADQTSGSRLFFSILLDQSSELTPLPTLFACVILTLNKEKGNLIDCREPDRR